MPDPPEISFPQDFVPQSSDQAQYQPHAYGRYDAPEGNAYSQGEYVTPKQADSQDSSLVYPSTGSYLSQHISSEQFSVNYGFDPFAQATWDWTQPVNYTNIADQYKLQGESVRRPQDQNNSAVEFSIPLPATPFSPPPRPLPQRPAPSPTMKRKSATETQSAHYNMNENQNPSKRQAVSRTSSTASHSPSPTVLADAQPSPVTSINVTQPLIGLADGPGSNINKEAQRHKGKGTGPQGREIDVSEPRRVVESSGNGNMLPAGRVFPIQIGSALFRLSGASLCSDAPSYFSHFFSEQLRNNDTNVNNVRTLYIDRDPDTFRDIALHLQGYHIVPRDGEHFVKLFADAQFYSLPRLTKQLFKSDIFISIGGTSFRIPRDTFSAPGDSPNYFSLGFAQWFSTPSEVFPGLDRNALLRPPSISPPSVPNKSGETFAELMKMLQGYDMEIRSDVHRSQLLRDARYFHLKGLEQRLIPHQISYNLRRQQSEILIKLEDIRQSGVFFTPDSPSPSISDPIPGPGFVSYARPYTDDASTTNALVLETSSSEATILHLPPFTSPYSGSREIEAHVTFHADTLRRMTSLLSVVASKMGLPSTQPLGLLHMQMQTGATAQPITPANSGISGPRVRVRLDEDSALEVNGVHAKLGVNDEGFVDVKRGSEWVYASPKENRADWNWVVRRAHWLIRIEAAPSSSSSSVNGDGEMRVQAVLHGVKIEAFTRERHRNASREFLGSA